jgi:hypothetical protein
MNFKEFEDGLQAKIEISEKVKLRLKGGASREGNLIYIVPLDPAYPALAGRGTFRSEISDTTDYDRLHRRKMHRK